MRFCVRIKNLALQIIQDRVKIFVGRRGRCTVRIGCRLSGLKVCVTIELKTRIMKVLKVIQSLNEAWIARPFEIASLLPSNELMEKVLSVKISRGFDFAA